MIVIGKEHLKRLLFSLESFNIDKEIVTGYLIINTKPLQKNSHIDYEIT